MNVRKKGALYQIESSSKKEKFYEVDLSQRSCTCPAFLFRYKSRGLLCKHIEAAIDYDEEFGHEDFQKIIAMVRDQGPIPTISLLEMFDEETVNELIQKGELLEEKGKLRILE